MPRRITVASSSLLLGTKAPAIPTCTQIAASCSNSELTPSLLPQAREELRPVRDDFEAKNKQLLDEMPRFYGSRLDYFQPSFESLIRAQVRPCHSHNQRCPNALPLGDSPGLCRYPQATPSPTMEGRLGHSLYRQLGPTPQPRLC